MQSQSLRICRLKAYQQDVEKNLMSDFNWKFTHQTLFECVIERIDSYRAGNGGLAHPLILIHALDFVGELLDTFGFSRPLQLGRLDSKEVDGFVSEVVAFRGQIRQLALSRLKSDRAKEKASPASKEGEHPSDASILLELCDIQREKLARRGIIVKVCGRWILQKGGAPWCFIEAAHLASLTNRLCSYELSFQS